MARTDADQCRATGIWPARPMTPFEPLPPPRAARPSRARRALEIAWGLIVALVLLRAVGGVALRAGHGTNVSGAASSGLGAGVRLKLPNYLRRMAVGRSTTSDFSLLAAATTAFL